MKIEWHPLARTDLAQLAAYVAADNPEAAYRLVEEIHRQIGQLASHPEMGRLGRVARTRELVVSPTPYIAAYHIRRETIIILRLLHGAQRWPKSFRVPSRHATRRQGRGTE